MYQRAGGFAEDAEQVLSSERWALMSHQQAAMSTG